MTLTTTRSGAPTWSGKSAACAQWEEADRDRALLQCAVGAPADTHRLLLACNRLRRLLEVVPAEGSKAAIATIPREAEEVAQLVLVAACRPPPAAAPLPGMATTEPVVDTTTTTKIGTTPGTRGAATVALATAPLGVAAGTILLPVRRGRTSVSLPRREVRPLPVVCGGRHKKKIEFENQEKLFWKMEEGLLKKQRGDRNLVKNYTHLRFVPCLEASN